MEHLWKLKKAKEKKEESRRIILVVESVIMLTYYFVYFLFFFRYWNRLNSLSKTLDEVKMLSQGLLIFTAVYLACMFYFLRLQSRREQHMKEGKCYDGYVVEVKEEHLVVFSTVSRERLVYSAVIEYCVGDKVYSTTSPYYVDNPEFMICAGLPCKVYIHSGVFIIDQIKYYTGLKSKDSSKYSLCQKLVRDKYEPTYDNRSEINNVILEANKLCLKPSKSVLTLQPAKLKLKNGFYNIIADIHIDSGTEIQPDIDFLDEYAEFIDSISEKYAEDEPGYIMNAIRRRLLLIMKQKYPEIKVRGALVHLYSESEY